MTIDIVQVIPYFTYNGCSVRIGKGMDYTEMLEPSQCIVYEFVETLDEVKKMIKLISNLPDFYRQKERSIEKLKKYLELRGTCPWSFHPDPDANDGFFEHRKWFRQTL